MLDRQSLKRAASILRKDASFLDALYSLPSVELYVVGLTEGLDSGARTTVYLDRLTLVGIEGDQSKVIPLPVLIRHLEPADYRGVSGFLSYFRDASQVRIARRGDRLSPAHLFHPFTVLGFSFTDEALMLDIVIKEVCKN